MSPFVKSGRWGCFFAIGFSYCCLICLSYSVIEKCVFSSEKKRCVHIRDSRAVVLHIYTVGLYNYTFP